MGMSGSNTVSPKIIKSKQSRALLAAGNAGQEMLLWSWNAEMIQASRPDLCLKLYFFYGNNGLGLPAG